MSVPLAVKFEGKKFLWDGLTYPNEDQAREAMEAYRKDGFEVLMEKLESDCLVYSRRIAAVQKAD